MPWRIQKPPAPLIAGTYPAEIKGMKNETGKYGERICWTVELTHEDHPYRAMGWTNSTFYPGSPELRWAQMILGELKLDDAFDESELQGAKVMARISVKEGGRDGPLYTVEDLLPPKGGEASEVGTDALTEAKDESDVPF